MQWSTSKKWQAKIKKNTFSDSTKVSQMPSNSKSSSLPKGASVLPNLPSAFAFRVRDNLASSFLGVFSDGEDPLALGFER